jgi:hypothetical protein
MKMTVQRLERQMQKAEQTLIKAESIIGAYEVTKTQLEASRIREQLLDQELRRKDKSVKVLSLTTLILWLSLIFSIIIRF